MYQLGRGKHVTFSWQKFLIDALQLWSYCYTSESGLALSFCGRRDMPVEMSDHNPSQPSGEA